VNRKNVRGDKDLQQLRHAVIGSRGETPSVVREQIEAFSARLSGRQSQKDNALSPRLQALVEKIDLHAYKVSDDDIRGLLDDGYSEDAVFEIVVCAAVGAGAARHERAMEALRDAST
jgi:hypothetical protein